MFLKPFANAVLLCMCAAALTAAVPAPASIPFTIDDGMVRVTATLGAAKAQPMLVDLGAGIDVLSTAAAARMHFSPDGNYTAARMRGDQVRTAIGTIPSITVGPVTARAPIVTAWSGIDGHGIAGLIAAGQFRSAPVTFDYVNHLLVFENESSLAALAAGTVRLPLSLQDDRGISLVPFARFDFGHGHTGLCELDTGSQGFFLDQHFARELGLKADTKQAVLPRLSLAGAPNAGVEDAKVRFETLIYDCNVGNDFWANRAFTIDIANRALYVR